MTASIADHGETLVPLMRKAGFRFVFLGIENVLEQDLEFFMATTKNTRRVDGLRRGNASVKAIQHLHDNGMYVLGGLIVGNPGDTREDIEVNLEFARRWVDWPYIQHPTPYPRTPMTSDLRSRGLISIQDVSKYDGTTAVVACENLSGREIEFMRWKAERWIKLRLSLRLAPMLFSHNPSFVLRHGLGLVRFLFRGSTIWSFVGLESEHKAFERYCDIRERERQYV